MTISRDNEHLTDVARLFAMKADGWNRKYDGPLRHRLETFSAAVQAFVRPGSRLLDFGCGAGALLCHLVECGYEVVGADISAEMLQACRIALSALGAEAELHCGEISELKHVLGRFDAVLCSSVLEYAEDPGQMLVDLRDVTAPNGVLLVTVPNRESLVRRLEWAVKSASAGLRLLGWSRMNQYLNYLRLSRNRYTTREFSELVVGCGWHAEDCPCNGSPGADIAGMESRNNSMLFAVLRNQSVDH